MSEEKRGRGRQKGDGTGNRGGGKRPIGKTARVKINITVDPELLTLVDAHAGAQGINRSEAINNLLNKALTQ